MHHTTYFGTWSEAKLKRALAMLDRERIRYETSEQEHDQAFLEEWCAWDPTAERPHIGFNLWIVSDDLPKLGTKIVDMFPERRFDA